MYILLRAPVAGWLYLCNCVVIMWDADGTVTGILGSGRWFLFICYNMYISALPATRQLQHITHYTLIIFRTEFQNYELLFLTQYVLDFYQSYNNIRKRFTYVIFMDIDSFNTLIILSCRRLLTKGWIQKERIFLYTPMKPNFLE